MEMHYMNAKSARFAIAAAAASVAGFAHAQEFGDPLVGVQPEQAQVLETDEAAFVQAPAGAIAQDQAQAERDMPAASTDAKPEDALAAYASEEGIQPYDPKTGRIVVHGAATVLIVR